MNTYVVLFFQKKKSPFEDNDDEFDDEIDDLEEDLENED